MLVRVWHEARARWHRGTVGSVNRSIAGAAAVTAALSLTPRALGFLKETVVAAVFGLSGEIEAYLVALTIVGIPSAVVLGPLQSTLIPALVSAKSEDSPESAARLLRGAISVTLIGLCLFLLMLLALPDVISLITGGWSAEKQARAASFVFGLAPYYLLSALNLLGYGALQARKRFFENALLPSLVPVGVVGVLLLSRGHADGWTLVVGLSLGTAAEFAWVSATLWRRERLVMLPGRISGDMRLASMLRQFSVLLPGTLAMAFMPVIDQTLASRAGEGAVAALAYGYRIPAFVSGILVTALGIAALPFFSQLAAIGNYVEIRRTLRRWRAALAVGGASVGLALIAASPWIVDFVFRRGAFSGDAAAIVTEVQRAYLLQLPGMLVGMLATRVLLAMGIARPLTIVTIWSVALHACVAWLLSIWIGVSGIALSAAITSSVNAVALYAIIHRRLRNKGKPYI